MIQAQEIPVKVTADDFNKMSVEEHAAITQMCIGVLATKVHELQELMAKLSKTYSTEMAICDVSLIVCLGSKPTGTVVTGICGTDRGTARLMEDLNEQYHNKKG